MIVLGIPSMLSRLYLGAHTIDQMIYGALVGVTIFFYTIFILREPLLLYAYKFVERKCTLREAILHSIYIILIILFIFGINFAVYFINVSTFEDPIEWRQSLVDKCDKDEDVLEENHIFAQANLEYMYSPTSTPACILGAIAYSYFADTPINNYYLLPVWKTLLRSPINALLVAPVYVIFMFLPIDDLERGIKGLISPFALFGIFCFLILSVGKYITFRCRITVPVRDEMEERKNESHQVSNAEA